MQQFAYNSNNQTSQTGNKAISKKVETNTALVKPPQKFSDFLNNDTKPIIQNVVSTANLYCELELEKIAKKCRNAEYNPKRFAAVIMRLKDPKTTALIFKSGKIVCTGAKSPEFSSTAIRKFARIIQKQGFSVQFREFKVQNIVCSCDFESDIFPGLVYKMIDPKMVLLIFTSGKLVLTGAKTIEDVDQAFKKIYPILIKSKQNQSKEQLQVKK